MRTSLKKKRFRFRLISVKKAVLPLLLAGAAVLFGAMFFYTAQSLLPLGAVMIYGREKAIEEQQQKSAVLPVAEGSLPEEYLLQQPKAQMPALVEENLPEPVPEIPEENKAALVYKTYQVSSSKLYLPLENGFIKNCTELSADVLQEAIAKGMAFSLKQGSEVQVLIMHTHTTESYLPFPEGAYDTTYATRSTDNGKNMAAVGEVIARQLQKAGIGVIHDTTQHDYPSYNGSYDRSRKTVERYLSEYPTIQVVLDIHRDAILSGDTVVAPVAEIQGETAAQLMIISGCDNGSMDYPNYLENLGFAAALQNALEGRYPGLTRPVLFDYRKYNQDLTSGSLLIEVGSHGNTLSQALYSAELLGETLAILLNDTR